MVILLCGQHFGMPLVKRCARVKCFATALLGIRQKSFDAGSLLHKVTATKPGASADLPELHGVKSECVVRTATGVREHNTAFVANFFHASPTHTRAHRRPRRDDHGERSRSAARLLCGRGGAFAPVGEPA